MTGRWLWALVAVVPLMTSSILLLEAELDGAVIPSYQATVGEGAKVDLDLMAVVEIERRNVAVCPAAGPAAIPTDLAATVAAECDPFDGHGGAGYVIGMSLAAIAGAVVARRFDNRAGALLTVAVALDAAGALFATYAIRGWFEDWSGVALAGTVGGVLSTVMLVAVVPALIVRIPTGRIRTRRWRAVVASASLVAAWLVAGTVVYPVVIASVVNPLAGPWTLATAESAMGLGWAAWMIVLLLAASSVPWRIYDGIRWWGARRASTSVPDDGDPAPAVTSQGGSAE